jgi:UDP-N-acetylmuramyl pentapeptide phosphotransferase/UDP-N-acetylglucosamine-1-phosphate transferase
MNEFNVFLLYSHIHSWFFFSLILNSAIALLWRKNFYGYFKIPHYQAIQRIHRYEIPRLGGFVILISLMGYALFSASSELTNLANVLFLILSPTIFFALKEDLYHNVKPSIRFGSILLSGLLFSLLYQGPWPEISIPFIGPFLSTQLGIIIFYPFAIAAIANGMNLVDGVNGLCAVVALSILGTLLFLSYYLADFFLLEIIILLMLLIVSFLILNYPKGFIFLGDLGAYSLGIIISVLVILFYGKHPEIPSWGGALAVAYPLTEVTFTLFRRLKNDLPSYKPDLKHLHLELYLFFKSHPLFKSNANSLVMPALFPLWLFPLSTMLCFSQKAYFVILSIFFFVLFYIFIYKRISKMRRLDN